MSRVVLKKEIKEKALKELLETGEPDLIAEKYGLHYKTPRGWLRQIKLERRKKDLELEKQKKETWLHTIPILIAGKVKNF